MLLENEKRKKNIARSIRKQSLAYAHFPQVEYIMHAFIMVSSDIILHPTLRRELEDVYSNVLMMS